MGMHPKHDRSAEIANFYALLFEDDKASALAFLQAQGLIDAAALPRWQALCEAWQGAGIARAEACDYFRAALAARPEDGVLLPARRTLQIIANYRAAIARFGARFSQVEDLRGKVALDFGAGVYSPLTASAVLYCNGFERAYAFEPFPIHPTFVQTAWLTLINGMIDQPAPYLFSGIAPDEFLARARSLLLPGLSDALQAFARRETVSLALGGVVLVSDMAALPRGGIDVHFSNSVLEHVDDIGLYFDRLAACAAPGGQGFHIVDFCDHRHYDDPRLHPMEKYYDGVCHEINGLLPAAMEAAIAGAGWRLAKETRQVVPLTYFEQEMRRLLPPYASASMAELEQYVNYYHVTR